MAKDREARGHRSAPDHQQVSQTETETEDTSDTEDQGDLSLNRKQRKRLRRKARKDLKNQVFEDCKAKLEEGRKARVLAEEQVEHINQVADKERRTLLEADRPAGRITRGHALSADNVLLTPGKSSLLEAVDTVNKSDE